MGKGARKEDIAVGRRQWVFLTGLIILGMIAAVMVFAILSTERENYVGMSLNDEQWTEVVSRNSPMVEYVHISPHAYFPRRSAIKKITIHHMGGDTCLEEIGDRFSRRDRTASANYAVDVDGRVGLYVEERNAAWTSSNSENDNQAVTIEVANDQKGGDWHVSNDSYEALIELVTDICLRNGIEKLEYTGDTSGNLTLHRMFTDTECPGTYLVNRMPEIVTRVNVNLRLAELSGDAA